MAAALADVLPVGVAELIAVVETEAVPAALVGGARASKRMRKGQHRKVLVARCRGRIMASKAKS